MARGYQFINKATGEAVNLAVVEKEIVSALFPNTLHMLNNDTFHIGFDACVWQGFAILMSMGGGFIDPEKVKAWLAKRPEYADDAETLAFMPYLDGTVFEFHAWG